jgi:hypothetical protein
LFPGPASGNKVLTNSYDGTLRVWNPDTQQTLWTAVLLTDGRSAVFDTAGNQIDGDPDVIERELVYLVETPTGRLEVLRPSQFYTRVRRLLASS